jgi:tetratricopeptide (TPR) repeat protein
MKRPWISAAVAVLLGPVSAFAIDTVKRREGNDVGGEVKTISRTEVVVFQKVGNKEIPIPANEVVDIDWDGEPAEFGVARGHEAAGNYPLALEQLTEAADKAKGLDAKIKADINFYIARSAARAAMADPAQSADAIQKLKAFTSAERENFRFFEAQELLAEVALRSNDVPVADTAFNSLTQAPWPDTKMLGKVGLARVLLASNNLAGAKTGFDEVAAMETKTPAETSRKLQAMLGQATCLLKQTQPAEALKIIDQVIEQATIEETRTLAEAYVRQGDCLAASGAGAKDAILSYLHVDVIPALAEERDYHAEALYHLSKLWGAVTQPSRAAEAAAKLQQLYPNSPWAQKKD